MADDKKRVYEAVFNVKGAIASLTKLSKKITSVDGQASKMLQNAGPVVANAIARIKGSFPGVQEAIQKTAQKALQLRQAMEKAQHSDGGKVTKKVSERVRMALEQERAAREKLNQAMASYKKVAKDGGKVAVKASRETEKATKSAARESARLAKNADRARTKLKKMFLGVGQDSRSGLGELIKNVSLASLALNGLYKIRQGITEAKADYFKFDEITTATLSMAKAGEKAFEYGSQGAQKYRKAIRNAAKDLRVVAGEMSNSALFWAKAGQTNGDVIAELSKVGTKLALANRDTAANVLDQATANDILSDALQMFGKDTSTASKAQAAATTLGDKITQAANISNHSVEQLWEFTKKVGPLAKTAGLSEDQIFAIAGSLASAGLKAEEPGRLVRRILTQFGREDVQKTLRGAGVEVADTEGNLRDFGDIFGDLQGVLKKQKPLQRMAFLKKVVGQNAISVAAALAGLNEKGEEGGTSIQTLLAKIEQAQGVVDRSFEQYRQTASGRVKGILADMQTAIGESLESSGLVANILDSVEAHLPAVIQWVETLGHTLQEVVIPGIQMWWENITEWLSPALTMISGLLGGVDDSAANLARTLTTLTKLWIQWRVALLAIKGLRMVDWVVQLVGQIKIANTSIRTIGTTTEAATATASKSVGKLPSVFSAAGVAIAVAIGGWMIGEAIHDAVVKPIRRAEKAVAELRKKFGEDLSKLQTGDLGAKDLQAQIQAEETKLAGLRKKHTGAMVNPQTGAIVTQDQKAVDAERDRIRQNLDRLKQLYTEQVKKDFGLDKDVAVAIPQSMSRVRPEGNLPVLPTKIAEEQYKAVSTAMSPDAEAIQSAAEQLVTALRSDAEGTQEANYAMRSEMLLLANELSTATSERSQEIMERMRVLGDRLQNNSDALHRTANRIAELTKTGEQQATQDRTKAAQTKRSSGYKGAFKRGGKSKKLDPYTTPLLTGRDAEGNKILNYAMQQGGAQKVFAASPDAKRAIEKSLTQNKNIQNVNFGDNIITVTAKSNAKPEDIGKAITKAMDRYGRQNQRQIQRILVNAVPAEI